MTTEPTREAIFKQRFISVLADLQQGGIDDPEAMALVGSLASDLAEALKQQNWSAIKQTMTAAHYDELLASFQARGNKFHQDGQARHAYAIQLLSVAPVGMTQRGDPDLAAGEKLMDRLIDQAVAIYRQARPRH